MPDEIDELRDFITALGSRATVVDFDEQVQLASVRATLRMWRQDRRLAGFAFLDDYANLWFDLDADSRDQEALAAEMIAWGVNCLKRRNRESGANRPLDCVCPANDGQRMRLLARHGFQLQDERSLKYERSLADPVAVCPLPQGFKIRPVLGEQEVEALVALHRQAFGTDHMTVAARLAMMRARQYRSELDLVVVAPDGSLAAFCVGGIDPSDPASGFTDPIGTRPRFRRQGLAKAVVSTTLTGLAQADVKFAALGTSSQNLAMRKLAESLGFRLVAEKCWFRRETP